eukprot:15474231-Alexandrium_andersonii.AAC.1
MERRVFRASGQGCSRRRAVAAPGRVQAVRRRRARGSRAAAATCLGSSIRVLGARTRWDFLVATKESHLVCGNTHRP